MDVQQNAVGGKASPHRAGSTDPSDLPTDTIGQRLRKRRIEMELTQEEVASVCVLTQRNNSNVTTRMKGDKYPLSRSAYCMYETDDVEPSIDVLEQLSRELRVDVTYLAFGIGQENPMAEIKYDPKTDELNAGPIWNFPKGWISENFGAKADGIGIVEVDDGFRAIMPGDMALIDLKAEPSRKNRAFAYAACNDDEVHVNVIGRPSNAGSYRVYDTETGFREVEPGDIRIIGAVVGLVSGNI